MTTPYAYQPCSNGKPDDKEAWEKVIEYINQIRNEKTDDRE